ncbi:MAG: hypothetical protein ACREKL_05180 [Chthoniobacterales bacterium]
MKKAIVIAGIVLSGSSLSSIQAAYTTLFSQDFSSSTTVSNYVSASSPTTGQFNAISTSGAAKAWTINTSPDNSLQLASTGGNAAYSSRTTDFSITPLIVAYTMELQWVSSSTALTSSTQFFLGSGFGTGNSAETNANTYAKFGLNTTASNGFVVRDISGSTNGATTFAAGTYTVSWYLNNSGASATYLAPDGSTESLANDTWDIWVGTSKQLNDRAVTTTTQSITDFKLGSDGNGTYTYRLDDISIVAIPEPREVAIAIMGLLGVLIFVHRRRNA